MTQKLKAEDLFEGLGREEEQPNERRIEVVQSGELTSLIKLFEMYLPIAKGYTGPGSYRKAGRIIDQSFSSRSITEFGIVLPKYCTEWALVNSSMLFVSVAMNRSNDLSYVLDFQSFPIPLDFVGYGLAEGKSLKVFGDCGICAGGRNQGDQVFNGNCGNWAGDSNQGIQEFHGSCRWRAGNYNKGTQRFNGEVGSFSRKLGKGNIYHKGRQIVKNGRKIK